MDAEQPRSNAYRKADPMRWLARILVWLWRGQGYRKQVGGKWYFVKSRDEAAWGGSRWTREPRSIDEVLKTEDWG